MEDNRLTDRDDSKLPVTIRTENGDGAFESKIIKLMKN